MELNPIKIKPLDFLGAFYDLKYETIYMRSLYDKKVDRDLNPHYAQNFTFEGEEWEKVYKTLKEINTDVRPQGIFFIVNGCGHSDDDVVQIKAQFVEMDDDSFEVQMEKIKAFKLPPSIIVKTQKSLHCYWMMDAAKRGRFREIQAQLIKHFNGDPHCINESRVMRVPGFYHSKKDPVVVQCLKFDPDIKYTQDELSVLLPKASKQQRESIQMAEVVHEGGRNGTLFRLACSLQTKGLADSVIVTTVHAANKEQCNPPLDDGEVDALLKSALKYDKEKIQVVPYESIEKNNAELVTVPVWCAEDYQTQTPFDWLYQYKDNKFVLAQLREKIKISAGAVGVKNFISLWNAYLQMLASQKGISMDNITEFDGQEMELFSGEYSCDDHGITTLDRTGFEIVVCNHPIMPITRLVNIDTGEVKIEIAYKKGKSWRTMVVEKNTLASSQKIIELSKYGISVDSESAKYLVRYFTDIEHLNYDKINEINSVGRLGWIGDHGFSPYVESIKFDGDLSFKSMFAAVKEKGKYSEWFDAVKEIRKNGVCARIMLASSFASALIEPCNALPFFVHLWGGTEAGKTVGLMLAASVWANPAMGEYIHTFNATIVGQEMAAGFVNSLPLCLDELQVIKERKDFDTIIYMLSEGIGRSRGAKAGGLQKMQTWRNCILTTGEMPISNSNSGGGAVNRIVEIDCKDEKLFQNPNEVVEILKKNYGFAGKMFVYFLQEQEYKDHAIKVQKHYYKKLSGGESTEKQAMAASLILAADKLIDEWIFQDGQILSINDIEQYLTTRKQVSQNERAYEWIINFVASNPNKFQTNNHGEYQGEVWGMYDDNYIYFNKIIFDQKMQESGFNPQSFLSWAKVNHKIDCDSNRTTKKKRIKGFENPIWCVWVQIPSNVPTDFTILSDEEIAQLSHKFD